MGQNWIKKIVVATAITLIQSVMSIAYGIGAMEAMEATQRDGDTFRFDPPQEPTLSYEMPMPEGLDSEPELHFTLDGAMEHHFWEFPDATSPGQFPVSHYPSVVIIPSQLAGGRVVVVPITKVMLVMPRWLFSNGQAGNWNLLPQGYQDARTISVPMR